MKKMKRFKKNFPCLICGGYDEQPRGAGKRCGGYLSNDGRYAQCMREDFLGELPLFTNSISDAHLLEREVNCGVNPDYLGDITRGSINGTKTSTWHYYVTQHREALDLLRRMHLQAFIQR